MTRPKNKILNNFHRGRFVLSTVSVLAGLLAAWFLFGLWRGNSELISLLVTWHSIMAGALVSVAILVGAVDRVPGSSRTLGIFGAKAILAQVDFYLTLFCLHFGALALFLIRGLFANPIREKAMLVDAVIRGYQLQISATSAHEIVTRIAVFCSVFVVIYSVGLVPQLRSTIREGLLKEIEERAKREREAPTPSVLPFDRMSGGGQP